MILLLRDQLWGLLFLSSRDDWNRIQFRWYSSAVKARSRVVGKSSKKKFKHSSCGPTKTRFAVYHCVLTLGDEFLEWMPEPDRPATMHQQPSEAIGSHRRPSEAIGGRRCLIDGAVARSDEFPTSQSPRQWGEHCPSFLIWRPGLLGRWLIGSDWAGIGDKWLWIASIICNEPWWKLPMEPMADVRAADESD